MLRLRWPRPAGLGSAALVFDAPTNTYELTFVGPEKDINDAMQGLFTELFVALPTEGDRGEQH